MLVKSVLPCWFSLDQGNNLATIFLWQESVFIDARKRLKVLLVLLFCFGKFFQPVITVCMLTIATNLKHL